jgi:hypothetical protein
MFHNAQLTLENAFAGKLAAAVLAAIALAPFAQAQDKIYQNDSIVAGSQANVQAGFIKNDIAAAAFTVPPADGTIFLQNARVLFFNVLGQSTTRKVRVLVYNNGNVNPGAPVYTSPIFTFIPGGENLVDLASANLEFTAGQTFTIGVKFEEEGLFINFSSVVTDKNGIQPNKNRIFDVTSGTWNTAESFGVTGDFGIRATITPNGPVHYGAGTAGTTGVPTIDTTGAWKVGNPAFTFLGQNAPPSSVVFLGISESAVSIPIVGITLLADPVTMLAFNGATNGAGVWNINVAIPPNPVLAGLHFYAQAFFADGGAPQGLSATDGLDILIN